jgi:glycosyltransferase involved in cell wall biosynthesis
MTIKIAYDYQAFALTPYGGGSRYLYEVSKIISQTEACEVKIIAPLHNNQYIKDSPVGMVVGKNYDNLQDFFGLTTYINKIQSKSWLQKNAPDILHETYYSTYELAPANCQVVLTVHDMIHEKFGNGMNASERDVIDRKKKSIDRADRIICVSENTKKDLLEIFDLDPVKVFVVHHGCSLTKIDDADRPPIIANSYLLYVGARGHYKNFKTLIQAYASSTKISHEFQLVCFGGGNFSNAEKLEIKRLGIKLDQIHYFAGDDLLLANLYSNATAFIYPSLYEGFGIPPIEAMYLGCPVVCSNAGSIPEVVGEAGYYFDPLSIENMISAIESVVFSEESRKNLIEQGRQRSTLFSWQKCAQETYNVYRDLISHDHR